MEQVRTAQFPGRRALVVDDEPDMRNLLSRLLEKKCGLEVRKAESAEKGLEILTDWQPEVVITDIKMPGIDGVVFFSRIRALDPTISTIIMTGFGTIEIAVQALKDGAYDFFQKPFDNDQIVHAVSRAVERTELLREKKKLEELCHQLVPQDSFQGFIGRAPRLLEVQDLLKRLAPSPMTVLIRGESGTGKELAARALHALSGRAKKPMVTVNCPALPENILESELFGYRKGAFTGAEQDKTGLFLEANNSTILLDEVADIPVSIQTKLLRVLQEKEIQPLGQTKTYPVDVRVIASTNQDIEAKIARGEFRADLYYRLNVVTVNMPNLTELKADIPLLINHFFKRFIKEHQREELTLGPEAVQLLLRRSWPGNIRELQNTINRAVLLAPGPELTPKDLMLEPQSTQRPDDEQCFAHLHQLDYAQAKEAVLQDFSTSYLRAALTKSEGNISLAAKNIGMERQALQRLLRRFEINTDDLR